VKLKKLVGTSPGWAKTCLPLCGFIHAAENRLLDEPTGGWIPVTSCQFGGFDLWGIQSRHHDLRDYTITWMRRYCQTHLNDVDGKWKRWHATDLRKTLPCQLRWTRFLWTSPRAKRQADYNMKQFLLCQEKEMFTRVFSRSKGASHCRVWAANVAGLCLRFALKNEIKDSKFGSRLRQRSSIQGRIHPKACCPVSSLNFKPLDEVIREFKQLSKKEEFVNRRL